MKAKFNQTEVQHELGVAPATAERIAGLLNGRINPDHFTSVEGADPLGDFGIPQQPDKILNCAKALLHADTIDVEGDPNPFNPDSHPHIYVNRGDDDIPTVAYNGAEFEIVSVNQMRGVDKAAQA